MKQHWKGSVLLAPVPPTLVSCGTLEKPNVLTVAWTGILATHPPMTYVSVRPERYSHGLIRQSGEFVINLPTAQMMRTVDFCGVRSGAQVDKFACCGLTAAASAAVSAPSIEECPVSLECRVTAAQTMGTHTVFMAEIVNVGVDEGLLDEKGRLDLASCGLLAYAHGEYFALGRRLGSFGESVRRKKSRKRKPAGRKAP